MLVYQFVSVNEIVRLLYDIMEKKDNYLNKYFLLSIGLIYKSQEGEKIVKNKEDEQEKGKRVKVER